jgi:putative flippase GtrA
MINTLKNNKLFVQLFKFGFVGGVAFLIDYLVLILSKEVFHFSILFSTAMGFCISVIFNYIASIKWVFDVDEKNSKSKNFILFIIFSIIGLILTEIIMHVGTSIFNINYLFVKIISTGIVMIFNFVTRKKFLE